MNSISRIPQAQIEPDSRALMEEALRPHILVGMPHLNPQGLSRTWLLKELGHRHWLLLARRLGMADADFRTDDGREAYAAICCLSLDLRLSQVAANMVLTIISDIMPVSPTRFESLHRLFADGREIGTVTLQSTFVSRSDASNRSIHKALVGWVKPTGMASRSFLSEQALALKALASGGGAIRRFEFRPSIQEEFNGAGLFYFAEFTAVIARAFEAWQIEVGPLTVAFLGNIEPGEGIVVKLMAGDGPQGQRLVRIARGDGAVLAMAEVGG